MAFLATNYVVSKLSTTATITVIRKGVTNATVTAGFTTSNGTARAGIDYLATGGTLTFNPGQITNTFTISILTNSPSLGNLSVNLILTNATGGAFVDFPSNSVLTILEAPGALSFAATNFLVFENATNAIITVIRTGGSAGNVSVTAATSPGTASEGLDYVNTVALLAWLNGDSAPKTFTIPIVNDQRFEPNETVILTLSSPTGFAVVGTNGTATLTIIDDDGPAGLDFGYNIGAGFNSSVFSLALQTNGLVVAGGAFTAFDGSGRNYVARLRIDGTLDGTFTPGIGPDNVVRAVAMQPDGKVLIGGDFTTVGGAGTVRNRIARLNANGTVDTTFVPQTGANSSVFDVALQSDGKVLIVGTFTNVSTVGRNRIARLNSTGTLDGTFNPGTGANNTINALALQTNGLAVIVGSFTSYNGTPLNRIARLTSAGAVDPFFNPGSGANNAIFAVAVQADGKIVIGGLFTTVSGQPRNRLARFNTDGSLDASFTPVLDDLVTAIVPQADGKLLIGGNFTMINGGTGGPPVPGGGGGGAVGVNEVRLVRLNLDGTPDLTFNSGLGADNLVYTIVQQPDFKIVLGGDFTTFNGAPRNRIARLNGNANVPIPTVLATTGAGFGTNRQFQTTLSGEAGRVYRIEGIASLGQTNWVPIITVTNSYGSFNFTDPGSVNQRFRFYRAILLP